MRDRLKCWLSFRRGEWCLPNERYLFGWEFDTDGLSCEALVNLAVHINLVNSGFAFVVEVDLQEFRSVGLDTCSLSDNFSWEDEVVQDGFVNVGKGSANWSCL